MNCFFAFVLKLFPKTQILRVISWSLIASFTLLDLSYAMSFSQSSVLPKSVALNDNLDNIREDISQLEIPVNEAIVKDYYNGQGSNMIILIEDAHANYSAQMSLANILEHFIEKYGINLILTEGSSRDVTLDEVKTLASSNVWKVAAKRLLNEGVIFGEEYLNLVSDHSLRIHGIEYEHLYNQGLNSYMKVVEQRETRLQYLHQVNHVVQRVKERFFPDALLHLEKLSSNDENIYWSQYIHHLLNLSQKAGISIHSDYQQISMLTNIQRLESKLNFEQINQELLYLIEHLVNKGLKSKINSLFHFIKKPSPNYFSQYLSILYLLKLAAINKVSVDEFSHLSKYVDYMKKLSEIDSELLLSEFDELQHQIYINMLIDNDDALKLRALDKYLDLLDKAYRLQMSSDEYRMLESYQNLFKTKEWLAFLNAKLVDVGYFEDFIPYKINFDDSYQHLREFYTNASDRDVAFLENAQRIMKSNDKNEALMIVGGYHTQHLKQLMKQNSISYVVLMPNITSKTNHAHYENLLSHTLKPLRTQTKKTFFSSKDYQNRDTLRPPNVADRIDQSRLLSAKKYIYGINVLDMADITSRLAKENPSNLEIYVSKGERASESLIPYSGQEGMSYNAQFRSRESSVDSGATKKPFQLNLVQFIEKVAARFGSWLVGKIDSAEITRRGFIGSFLSGIALAKVYNRNFDTTDWIKKPEDYDKWTGGVGDLVANQLVNNPNLSVDTDDIYWQRFIFYLNISDWAGASSIINQVMPYSIIIEMHRDDRFEEIGKLLSYLDWMNRSMNHIDTMINDTSKKKTNVYVKGWFAGKFPMYLVMNNIADLLSDIRGTYLSLHDWFLTLGQIAANEFGRDGMNLKDETAAQSLSRWQSLTQAMRFLDILNHMNRPPAIMDNGTRSGAPLWIGEQHQNAFSSWMRLMNDDVLTKRESLSEERDTSKNILVHIDAHEDFIERLFGENLDKFNEIVANESIDIKAIMEFRSEFQVDGFVIPALYLGLFQEFAWVFPYEQFDEGSEITYPDPYKIRVGIVEEDVWEWIQNDSNVRELRTKKIQKLVYERVDAPGPKYNFLEGSAREVTIRHVSPEALAENPYEVLNLHEGDKIFQNLDIDVLGTHRGVKKNLETLPDYKLSKDRMAEIGNSIREYHEKVKRHVVGGFVAGSPNFTHDRTIQMRTILNSVVDFSRKQPKFVHDEFNDKLTMEISDEEREKPRVYPVQRKTKIEKTASKGINLSKYLLLVSTPFVLMTSFLSWRNNRMLRLKEQTVDGPGRPRNIVKSKHDVRSGKTNVAESPELKVSATKRGSSAADSKKRKKGKKKRSKKSSARLSADKDDVTRSKLSVSSETIMNMQTAEELDGLNIRIGQAKVLAPFGKSKRPPQTNLLTFNQTRLALDKQISVVHLNDLMDGPITYFFPQYVVASQTINSILELRQIFSDDHMQIMNLNEEDTRLIDYSRVDPIFDIHDKLNVSSYTMQFEKLISGFQLGRSWIRDFRLTDVQARRVFVIMLTPDVANKLNLASLKEKLKKLEMISKGRIVLDIQILDSGSQLNTRTKKSRYHKDIVVLSEQDSDVFVSYENNGEILRDKGVLLMADGNNHVLLPLLATILLQIRFEKRSDIRNVNDILSVRHILQVNDEVARAIHTYQGELKLILNYPIDYIPSASFEANIWSILELETKA